MAVKRGCDPEKWEEVITILCDEQSLLELSRDQSLANSTNYLDMRDCHIQPDWLLVYKITQTTHILKLVRTRTHSDLF